MTKKWSYVVVGSAKACDSKLANSFRTDLPQFITTLARLKSFARFSQVQRLCVGFCERISTPKCEELGDMNELIPGISPADRFSGNASGALLSWINHRRLRTGGLDRLDVSDPGCPLQ